MHTITATDFAAANAADPEVHAEFLALRRGEDLWHASWVASGSHPERARDPISDAELTARAEATIAQRRAWRESPAGQLHAAIRDLEDMQLGPEAVRLLSRARSLLSMQGFDAAREELSAVFSQLRALLTGAREKVSDAWLLVA